MLDATSEWYFNIDQGKTNAVAFLDLTKALVTHVILLKKLELFGISGVTLNWFKSYLSELKQCCVIKECTSQVRYITCGVPQGSILGPLLFLICINDLPACLRFSTARMYADDTNITVSSKSTTRLHKELNYDLESIRNWLLANQFSLNLLRSEYMYFASDFNLANLDLYQAETVHIGDKPLKRVSSTEPLGIRIDQRLVWEEHIDSLCKRASTSVGALRQACRYAPQETPVTYI